MIVSRVIDCCDTDRGHSTLLFIPYATFIYTNGFDCPRFNFIGPAKKSHCILIHTVRIDLWCYTDFNVIVFFSQIRSWQSLRFMLVNYMLTVKAKIS